jgi:2-polyprenyl-6-methoxyphenol hydroxylase-like FAD-dependent oxidoreductase
MQWPLISPSHISRYTMSDSTSCTTLVVGAGPVGLTMAAQLHHHSLNCRIIDQCATPSDKSKALVLWARSLEMLDDLGIAGHFVAAGRFLDAATIYSRGRALAHVPFAATGTQYPRPLMIAQSETERLLVEHLRSVGISVERSVTLTGFVDQGDHILATIQHDGGLQEQVRCAWLLGCDGAHSTTRKTLGLEFTGVAEPNDWILADCRVEGPLPPNELSFFWHHHGILGFFPFADRCRIIADMGVARTPTKAPDPSLAEVQRIVDERGPRNLRLAEPHWLASFRINERKVAHYGRGRVLLAGDAAHIHSPAGGQGMNTGMQDAWNLAWKLALVESGRAPVVLLDSYSPERSAIGARVLREASRMTRMVMLRNPIAQYLRNRIMGVVSRLTAFRRSMVHYLTELWVHYPDSPLNGENGTWANGIRPGDRLPDAILREPGSEREVRLLNIVHGPRFHLLLLPGGDQSDMESIRERITKSYADVIRTHLIVTTASEGQPPGTTWLDRDGAVAKLLGARGPAIALVRPDGYLAYRAAPPSWSKLQEYLSRFLVPAN